MRLSVCLFVCLQTFSIPSATPDTAHLPTAHLTADSSDGFVSKEEHVVQDILLFKDLKTTIIFFMGIVGLVKHPEETSYIFLKDFILHNHMVLHLNK